MIPKRTRAAAVLVWALVLLVFTGTENLNNLLLHKQLVFVFNPEPDFAEFFNWTDVTRIHHVWVIVKLGHFIGFAILDLLVFNWLRNRPASLLISILFALATEILQLYLNRDGRLYDVLIDSFGALTAGLVSHALFRLQPISAPTKKQ
ncbi:VanZ like family protein [Paenibacillus sp. RU4T]|nr:MULTISPECIES: VanZ family protein [unclassified Paenibacillus]ASS65896.2 VanZ family protein [Paenibacillus sp. RUD330]SIQ19738.1 VanZ like family protein [Paenibacillus sp. RU4X]SIQ41364.1 VanZ like family protein [Paenibacillus sp. RU4T]